MVSGTGIGFRPRLAGALLRRPERVDFIEVVAESCRDLEVRREVVALSRIWPVVLHGVSLSPGSAEGVDLERVGWFAELARELDARLVSEHMAFVRAGGREIGHLTELPRTRAAVAVLARNVATLRRRLPDVPLLLENAARAFVWPGHEMGEAAFLHEVTRATGCPLLLDVANLHANAVNGDVTALDDLPLERVGLVHVAGGTRSDADAFWFDTHAHAVPEAVFAMAAEVLRRTRAPVLLERDAALDDPEAVLEEVDRLRALGAGALSVTNRQPTIGETGPRADDTALRASQAEMARALLGNEQAPRLAQARKILERKRGTHERTVRCVAVEHGTRPGLLGRLRLALRGRNARGEAPHPSREGGGL